MIQYQYPACQKLVTSLLTGDVEARLMAARDEAYEDVTLLDSGQPIPAVKQPLDSGFIQLPLRLLNEYAEKKGESQLGQILATAKMLQEELDRIVVLGIGGSYMGLRAIVEALRDPYHNELTREARNGIPRLYYEGNNVDGDATLSLLSLLKSHCKDPKTLAEKWGIVVISKSGGTLETAVAFRIFLEALESFYGATSPESRKYVVPVTGETGKLRSLSNAKEYPATFPIPDGVGGRFSIFTAVGLLPAAVLGIDIVAMLEGAAEMTGHCQNAGLGSNPALDYVAVCHLLEQHKGLHTRILSTWGKKLEAVGLWYDQLLAESLGKHEKGAFPLTVVNTRDLHSRGQQHQEGIRDKLITNVVIEKASKPSPAIPKFSDNFNQDDLNRLFGKDLSNVMTAAIQGTNKAYLDVDRPTADIILPEMNARYLGQLFQMLMLATVIEGRLVGTNPYGQPGVEAYKQNMNAILAQNIKL
jgi:glucose-6-phosphate isomerase